MSSGNGGRTVVVLGGGKSREREVSLVSAREVTAACLRLGYAAIQIDPATPDFARHLVEARPTCVFNALHGSFGEDGRMQGYLETLGIPYTHSGVLASALAMDKPRARQVFAAGGLDIAQGCTVRRHMAAKEHIIAPPYVIKPLAEGSSVGIIIVAADAPAPPPELSAPSGQRADSVLPDCVLIEEFIPGCELTVSVMGEDALAVTEIRFLTKYYDYSAKYEEDGSRHILPADVPANIYDKALETALCAHRILGCRGVTRTDLRFDPASDRLVILETNTQPGMTPVSLVPEQAAHRGVSFEELVEWIVNDASCPR